MSRLARSGAWAEAVQFAVLAVVAPGLFLAAAPWERIGLGGAAHRLADHRRRHPGRLRAALVVGAALAVEVAWRTPGAVDRLQRGGWFIALEAVSLSVAGGALWLEAVASPPLVPRSPRPVRMVIAAVTMWTLWITAYLVAMSHVAWYPGYLHVAGRGLSLAADQQIAAGVLWSAAALSFVPVIFWNLVQWLRAEEDPDEQLQRFVREERRRAFPPHPSR